MTTFNKHKKYYINSAVGISIMIFGRFLPPILTFSELGMEVMGIFAGTLYLWISTNSITWPSILAVVLLGLGNFYEGSFANVMTPLVTNSTMQMLALSLSIFSLLTTSKVADQISNRIISSQFIRDHPWMLTAAIIMIAYICAMLKAPYIVIYICWQFIYTICGQTGLTKNDKWTKMVITGVPFATTVGMVTLPFSIAALGGFGILSNLSGGLYTFNAGRYTLFAQIFGLTVLVVYFLLCRFIIRPDMSKLKGVDLGIKIEPFNKEQKFALFIIALYVVCSIIPALTPAEWFISRLYKKLSLVGIGALVLVVVLFPRDDKGRDLYTFGDLCKAANVWNLIIMMAVANLLGSTVSDARVGFVALFDSLFGNLFKYTGPFFLAIVACTAAALLTNVINNGVTMTILLPIVYAFAMTMEISPIPASVMVIWGSASGFLLPSSSAAGAILNANVDWINLKDILRYGIVGSLSLILAAALIGIHLAGLIL